MYNFDINEMNENLSERFLDIYKNLEKVNNNKGIGSLAEKSLHKAIKYFYEPDDSFHEIKTGNYVADIKTDNKIIEVQTGSFIKLKEKLDYYFSEDYSVTVVIPVYSNKRIKIIDSDGKVLSSRMSPVHKNLYSLSKDLYFLKYVKNSRKLFVDFLYLDVDEIKVNSNFRYKNTKRIDIIPNQLMEIVHTGAFDNYESFIPFGLPYYFSSKEFAYCAGINRKIASYSINFLIGLGKIEYYGRKGREKLYYDKEIVLYK